MTLTRELVLRHLAFAGVLLLAIGGTASGNFGEQPFRASREACPQPALSASYLRRVDHALRAKEDTWGNALLATPSGPTYERIRRYLTPLLLTRASVGKPLTDSGFHYLAFMQPNGAQGSGSAALHVADGSQIVSQRSGGRALTIGVGSDGRERYGSCLARLTLPRLAAGYLPILETGTSMGRELATARSRLPPASRKRDRS